ncbi:MAG TPA: signal peptidase I [Actinomycetales bacterium]|nr:signal peptidase I [Actinomycetales bacterium]
MRHAARSNRENNAPSARNRSKTRGFVGWLRELGIIIGLALVISFLVKTFLLQAFYIPSESMEQTLLRGDRVIVNKLGADKINRGDIVVFTDPGSWLGRHGNDQKSGGFFNGVLTFIGVLPQDDGNHLIKRVIGIGGDEVACCDSEGRVTVNGIALKEEYLAPGSVPHRIEFETTVPDGYLWMMGDNRSHSGDSRMHLGDPGGGAVSEKNVVGIAFLRVWPFDRFSVLKYPSEVFSAVNEK